MIVYKRTLLILSSIFCFACNHIGSSKAKRAVPKEVTPIVINNALLSAPPSKMGYIVAVDTLTNKLLWEKKIYTVFKIPLLEADVQDRFIDSMYLKGNTLIIRNEDNRFFELNLNTKDVKELYKGS